MFNENLSNHYFVGCAKPSLPDCSLFEMNEEETLEFDAQVVDFSEACTKLVDDLTQVIGIDNMSKRKDGSGATVATGFGTHNTYGFIYGITFFVNEKLIEKKADDVKNYLYAHGIESLVLVLIDTKKYYEK